MGEYSYSRSCIGKNGDGTNISGLCGVVKTIVFIRNDNSHSQGLRRCKMTEEEIREKIHREFINAIAWERAYKLDALHPDATLDTRLEHKFYSGAVYALGDLICALWGVDTYIKFLEDTEY